MNTRVVQGAFGIGGHVLLTLAPLMVLPIGSDRSQLLGGGYHAEWR